VFRTLRDLTDDVKTGRFDRVRTWAMAHREKLKKKKSSLEYMLHRHEFLQLALGRGISSSRSDLHPINASTTNVSVAFSYGRRHFLPHFSTHLLQIQQLFSLLLFLPSIPADDLSCRTDGFPDEEALLAQVPDRYRDMIHMCDKDQAAILDLFHRDYCAVSNIPLFDPLEISVNVGADVALSRLMKVRKMMQERGHEWSQADELPIEIPIPQALNFHSTFICPVSKEVATDENPPMKQPCGHVLCLESLQQIHQARNRIKCPYCPAESKLSDACRVYF